MATSLKLAIDKAVGAADLYTLEYIRKEKGKSNQAQVSKKQENAQNYLKWVSTKIERCTDKDELAEGRACVSRWIQNWQGNLRKMKESGGALDPLEVQKYNGLTEYVCEIEKCLDKRIKKKPVKMNVDRQDTKEAPKVTLSSKMDDMMASVNQYTLEYIAWQTEKGATSKGRVDQFHVIATGSRDALQKSIKKSRDRSDLAGLSKCLAKWKGSLNQQKKILPPYERADFANKLRFKRIKCMRGFLNEIENDLAIQLSTQSASATSSGGQSDDAFIRQQREERGQREAEQQERMHREALAKKKSQSQLLASKSKMLQQQHLFLEQVRDVIGSVKIYGGAVLKGQIPMVLEALNIGAAGQVDVLRSRIRAMAKKKGVGNANEKRKQELCRMALALVDEWKMELQKERLESNASGEQTAAHKDYFLRMKAFVGAIETLLVDESKVARMANWKLKDSENTQEGVSQAMANFLGAGHVLDGQLQDVEARPDVYSKAHKDLDRKGKDVKKKIAKSDDVGDYVPENGLFFDIPDERLGPDSESENDDEKTSSTRVMDHSHGAPDVHSGCADHHHHAERPALKNICPTCNYRMEKKRLKYSQPCIACGHKMKWKETAYVCIHKRGVRNVFACLDCVEGKKEDPMDVDTPEQSGGYAKYLPRFF